MAGACALPDAAEPAGIIQPQPAPANPQGEDTFIPGRDAHDPGIPIAAAAASNKAPRGRKRLTAIALTATLLTSVTATAAQGPDILGDLSTMFEAGGGPQDSVGTEAGAVAPGSPLGNSQGKSSDSAARQGSQLAADFGSWAPGTTYPGVSGTQRFGFGPRGGSAGQGSGTGQQDTSQGDVLRNASLAPKAGSGATPSPVPTGSAAVADPVAGQDPTQSAGPTQSPADPGPDPTDPTPEPTPLPPTEPVPDPAPDPTSEPTAEPAPAPEPDADPATGNTEPAQDPAALPVPAG